MKTPLIASAVLFAVVVVYLPSLSGGWVWDDHALFINNAALSDPSLLLRTDIFGATAPQASDMWRPLVTASQALGQAIAPGPLTERLGNLALHLCAVLLVASTGGRLGLGSSAAWLGAAVFGLHAGASEAVAWISGRYDLLMSVLLLAGWHALLGGRELRAGGLVALASFAKESAFLGPLTLLPVMFARGRWSPRALGLSLLGPALAWTLRTWVGLPVPIHAAQIDWLGGTGGLASRAAWLLVVPATADALPIMTPSVPAAGVALLLVLGVVLLACRYRQVAMILAPLPVMLPAVAASIQSGLVADRYLYLLVASLGLAVALAMAAAAHALGPKAALLWLLTPLIAPPLALSTWQRAGDWTSDSRLFSAAYAAHPDSAPAAYHLGHALSEASGDCTVALPLYRQAVQVDPRARLNLLACLVQTGDYSAATKLGPDFTARAPEDPRPAASTARAFALLGQPDIAAVWAATAVARGGRAQDFVLQGNIMGVLGDLDAAQAAFSAALQAPPGPAPDSDLAEARKGLDEVVRHRQDRQQSPVAPDP